MSSYVDVLCKQKAAYMIDVKMAAKSHKLLTISSTMAKFLIRKTLSRPKDDESVGFSGKKRDEGNVNLWQFSLKFTKSIFVLFSFFFVSMKFYIFYLSFEYWTFLWLEK